MRMAPVVFSSGPMHEVAALQSAARGKSRKARSRSRENSDDRQQAWPGSAKRHPVTVSSRMSLPPSLFELRRTSRSCGFVARPGQHSRSFVQVRRRSACRLQPGTQRASDHRRRRSDRHALCADCPAHRTGSPLSPTRLEFQPASLEPTMCVINVQGLKIETD
jgi:hypothetical protein